MMEIVRVDPGESSLSGKGGRVVSVRVSSSVSFDTPVRPLSVAETTAKDYLGYRGILESPIAIMPIDLQSNDGYTKFLRHNGFIHDNQKVIQSFTDRNHGKPCAPLLQLPPLDFNDRVPFKIAFDLQKDVDGLTFMCMPEVDIEYSDYERAVRDWCSSCEDYGRGGIVQLSLSDDPEVFKRRLSILSELSQTGEVQMINIRYSPRSTIQLSELWNKKGEINALINCSEVPTTIQQKVVEGIERDIEYDLLSHGFDSITRKKRKVSPKFMASRNFADPPTTMDKIDKFKVATHQAAVMIGGDVWRLMEHSPECKCSVCKGNSNTSLIDRFAYKDNGDIDPSGMRYFARLHDHQSDNNELGVLRKYIRECDTPDYEIRLDDNLNGIVGEIRKSR